MNKLFENKDTRSISSLNADDVTHFKLNNLNWGWGILNGILGAKNFLSCQKLILIGQTISLKRNNFYELIYPISEHFFVEHSEQVEKFFKNSLFLGAFFWSNGIFEEKLRDSKIFGIFGFSAIFETSAIRNDRIWNDLLEVRVM